MTAMSPFRRFRRFRRFRPVRRSRPVRPVGQARPVRQARPFTPLRRFSPFPRRLRQALAAGAVPFGLLALSACEKPSPNAHFTLGADTSSPEAAERCWQDSKRLPEARARDCLAGVPTGEAASAPRFTARSGDTFRVGVDPQIAEHGWLLFVNGQPYGLDPFTSTYRSFRGTDLYAVAQRNQSANELPAPDELVINVAQVVDDYEVSEMFEARTQEEFEELLFASFDGVWHALLTSPEGG